MEFCPDCRSIMARDVEDKMKFICPSCGKEKIIKEIKNEKYNVKRKAKKTVTNLGEVEDMRSTVNEVCPECGHDKAYSEIKQTRSADEAPTRIFTCAKCKHTWRAYH